MVLDIHMWVVPTCSAITTPHIYIDQLSILHFPVEQQHIPDPTIRRKIAKHLKTLFGGLIKFWMDTLPQMMPHWEKVHIGNGGDLIWGALTQARSQQGLHDASFVHVGDHFMSSCYLQTYMQQYELNVDVNAYLPQAKEDFIHTIYCQNHVPLACS